MRDPVLLAAAAALILAAAAPSGAAADPAGAAAAAPPPPPGQPGALAPPPPPNPGPGPGVVVDRRADGTLHIDVRCPPRDAIRDCAAIATGLLAKLNGPVKAD